jgi:DNA-directed RNA polymerase subunit RPC12/RpoP
MVNKDNVEMTCPICGGKDFFPHERKGQQMLKCIKCGKENKLEDIFKPVKCEDGSCKI